MFVLSETVIDIGESVRGKDIYVIGTGTKYGSLISVGYCILGHGFFICWITLHFKEFRRPAIGKKKVN